MGLLSHRDARCWQCCRPCAGNVWLSLDGRAGRAVREHSLGTALICADSEGLPWQPGLLLLLIQVKGAF